jgi:3-deoxy-7-phosphoheptulonate synthase
MNAPDRPVHPVSLPEGWAPGSWRDKAATQQPAYPDAVALEGVLGELGRLPPLVTSWEILALRKQVAEAQEGKRLRREF